LHRRNEGLAVITQDSMTIDDIEVLLKDTEHNGYPVVVSRENQYLVGFVLRKDLNLALGNDDGDEDFYQSSSAKQSNLFIFCSQCQEKL
jgi:Mg2+/Co2+ transporter CorC